MSPYALALDITFWPIQNLWLPFGVMFKGEVKAALSKQYFGAFCLDVRTLTFCHLMSFHETTKS